ncbi:MAG: hypothetical protein JNJ54_11425 [Myxococcaceae bacterium]|nr:hypothetical protein [Myxococcaceae bacterium]
MEDFIFTPIVLAVGLAIHAVALRTHDREEGRLLTLSFAFHVASSIGLILVYTYYYTEGGDMISYHRLGVPVAEALRYDFEAMSPEVVSLLLQREHRLPFEVLDGSSTGSMQAVAIILSFLLGNSLFASAALIGIFSYVSKVLAFRALKRHTSPPYHRHLGLALLLSPSGVVWTSVLLKESVVMVFMGPFLLAVIWLVEGRRLALALTLAAASGAAISLFKPYVLMALVAGAASWILVARGLRDGRRLTIRPLYLGLAAAIAVGGFAGATAFFPKLTLDSVGDSMAYQRRVAGEVEGGSNFSLEGPGVDRDTEKGRSLSEQLALAPLALVTALFRPFIFEARKAMQLLNALEMTWLLVLFVQALRTSGVAASISRVLASPVLSFCVVFTLVLALGTGLSTANLGALSRYRAPMMPFFLFLLLALRQRATVTEPPASVTEPQTNRAPLVQA